MSDEEEESETNQHINSESQEEKVEADDDKGLVQKPIKVPTDNKELHRYLTRKRSRLPSSLVSQFIMRGRVKEGDEVEVYSEQRGMWIKGLLVSIEDNYQIEIDDEIDGKIEKKILSSEPYDVRSLNVPSEIHLCSTTKGSYKSFTLRECEGWIKGWPTWEGSELMMWLSKGRWVMSFIDEALTGNNILRSEPSGNAYPDQMTMWQHSTPCGWNTDSGMAIFTSAHDAHQHRAAIKIQSLQRGRITRNKDQYGPNDDGPVPASIQSSCRMVSFTNNNLTQIPNDVVSEESVDILPESNLINDRRRSSDPQRRTSSFIMIPKKEPVPYSPPPRPPQPQRRSVHKTKSAKTERPVPVGRSTQMIANPPSPATDAEVWKKLNRKINDVQVHTPSETMFSPLELRILRGKAALLRERYPEGKPAIETPTPPVNKSLSDAPKARLQQHYNNRFQRRIIKEYNTKKSQSYESKHDNKRMLEMIESRKKEQSDLTEKIKNMEHEQSLRKTRYAELVLKSGGEAPSMIRQPMEAQETVQLMIQSSEMDYDLYCSKKRLADLQLDISSIRKTYLHANRNKTDYEAKILNLKTVDFTTASNIPHLHNLLDINGDGLICKIDFQVALTEITGHIWTKKQCLRVLTMLGIEQPEMGASQQEIEINESELLSLIRDDTAATVQSARQKQLLVSEEESRHQETRNSLSCKTRNIMTALATLIKKPQSIHLLQTKQLLLDELRSIDQQQSSLKISTVLTPSEELLLRRFTCSQRQAEINKEEIIRIPKPVTYTSRPSRYYNIKSDSPVADTNKENLISREPPPKRVQVLSKEYPSMTGQYLLRYVGGLCCWVHYKGNSHSIKTLPDNNRWVMLDNSNRQLLFSDESTFSKCRNTVTTTLWENAPHTTVVEIVAPLHQSRSCGSEKSLSGVSHFTVSSAFRHCPTPASRLSDPLHRALDSAHKGFTSSAENIRIYEPPQTPFS